MVENNETTGNSLPFFLRLARSDCPEYRFISYKINFLEDLLIHKRVYISNTCSVIAH